MVVPTVCCPSALAEGEMRWTPSCSLLTRLCALVWGCVPTQRKGTFFLTDVQSSETQLFLSDNRMLSGLRWVAFSPSVHFIN